MIYNKPGIISFENQLLYMQLNQFQILALKELQFYFFPLTRPTIPYITLF